MKTDILAFGAHPDDIELSCSGTIIKHALVGKKIAIADLTRGELGTRGNADLRLQEAAESAKIMGVAFRENLNFKDGFFLNDERHQMEVIKIIRKYQPEIILCNAISDRHPDHAKAAQLVSDACFLSGLLKIETSLQGEKQMAHRPQAVYHYIQDRYIKPDFVVDISDVMEKRMESIHAFKSQFFDNEKSNEPQTYISSKEFMESLQYRPAEMGRIIGVKYAEGFTASRFIGVKNIFDLI